MHSEDLQDQTRFRSIFELVPVSLWEEDWTRVRTLVQQWRAEGVQDFATFFRNHPEAVQAALHAVQVLDVNQVTVDTFEASSREQLTASLGVIYDADEPLLGFLEELTAFANGERLFEIETPLRTIRGNTIHGLVRVAYPPPDAETCRVFASIMDVTARKRAEQRFRTIAQATSDMVWDYDLRTGTIWWSNGLDSSLEPPANEEELDLSTWLERVHPEDREQVKDHFRATLRDGSDYRAEYRFRLASGDYALVLDRGVYLTDPEGIPCRMIGNMVDITEQRRLEARLHQAQKLETLGQLTGGIAHDFNNLLTVIIGNSSLLGDALEQDPDLHALVEMTETAARQGSELTRRLLAFARRQALAPRPIQVDGLIDDLRPILSRTLGAAISLQIDGPDALWPAMIDRSQLENALLNLCLNARDAMPDGGRLSIELSHRSVVEAEELPSGMRIGPGDYVVLAVSDSGTGMSETVQTRAFEPFFTTKDVGTGSGLGLSMIYGFMKQSRGHVELISSLDEGTTIKLYLPRARTGASAEAPAVSGGETALPGGREHVLLVEDNPLVRSYAQEQLRNFGYRVTPAENARQALDLLEQGSFDVLFSDIVMPGGIDGLELARLARTRHPELPVLLASGYARDVARAQEGGPAALPILQKPYDRHDLAYGLRSLLDQAGHPPPVPNGEQP